MNKDKYLSLKNLIQKQLAKKVDAEELATMIIGYILIEEINEKMGNK